ncbi:MAG: nucleotidyltransferase domain-containing protein [Acidimicrobiales bacterium]
MSRTVEVVDGKVRYDGRTLAEWVPEVVADIVDACGPLRVILFGSVARGDDGPDSDIDLLIQLETIAPSSKVERMAEIRRTVRASVAMDILVTDATELALRGDLPGILRVARREGETVYERPA